MIGSYQPSPFRRIVSSGLFIALAVSLRCYGQEQQTGNESTLLSSTRQLTFAGRRAGEGYFSKDGSKMVFQSERESGNPFFQIYLMDLDTGDLERISPGHGKTTCAWIHPDGDRVLFASTQEDLPTAGRQDS